MALPLRSALPGWLRRHPRLAAAAVSLVVALALAAVAVPRLLHGPLVEMARPWIERSLAQRLGPGYQVTIGAADGSEDLEGLTVLKLRDLAVQSPEGRTVATVPMTEIALDSGGLLSGPNPRRIEMSGAEMVIQIDNGKVTMSARPAREAAVPAQSAARPTAMARSVRDIAKPPLLKPLIDLLTGIERDGFGGLGLSAIGLKHGTLVVDDTANGQRWRFENIVLSLTRPSEGGVTVTIASGGTDGPWSVTATISNENAEFRAIDIVARDLSPKDLLLALGLADADLHADSAIDAMVRARVARDGTLAAAELRIHAGAGQIGPRNDPEARMVLDELRADLHWEAQRGTIFVEPLILLAGANRTMLTATIKPPESETGAWVWQLARGRMELADEQARSAPLVLDRISGTGRVEPMTGVMTVDRIELGGSTVAAAATAYVTTKGANPTVQLGLTGSRMPVHVVKRLWPAIVSPAVRAWVFNNVHAGILERCDIALNSPLEALMRKELPLPDNGLHAEFVLSDGVVSAVGTLPPIREFEGRVVATGRTVAVTASHAIIESNGRRLDLSDGAVDMPDTYPKAAPIFIRLRADGPADALAELLQSEILQAQGMPPLDPATTRGTLSAKLQISLPLVRDVPRSAVSHTVDGVLTGFSADKLFHGQRLENATVRVSGGSARGLTLRGDGKVAGAPFSFEVRGARAGADADVRFQTVLDDAARGKLGFDAGAGVVVGTMPLKAQGKVGARDSRLSIETDLKDVAITDLIPGWTKARGRPARATFTLIERDGVMRLEDLVLDGSGAMLKGTVELDAAGDPTLVNLPTFQLSDGDRASLKLERGADGVLRISLRGEVFDGRGLLKTLMSGPSVSAATNRRHVRPRDLDVDTKVGVVVGFNGETARQLDVRMSRRNGELRAFGMTARIGADASLKADLRVRDGTRTNVVAYANDAGALLRFIDIYSKIIGGDFWMFIDPPSTDGQGPQEGVLNVTNFGVIDPGLDRLIASAPAEPGAERPAGRPARGLPVHFTKMRVNFVRAPGRMTFKDGVIWGPQIGATVEGQIDYAGGAVGLRGTYVPAYGLNNLFARIPIVGLFMGGPNEGLVGVTYEIVGPPAAPVLRINPISAVAPGFLRKLFEFRGTPDAPPPDVVAGGDRPH